jgi:hypothetical protein
MDELNELFRLASEMVNHTSKSLFVTGKAGTGKTTFLRYVKENTAKNTIVAAPTGVAAINAGGTTLHSLFQLPLEPFIPNREGGRPSNIFRINKSKIDMLVELELLVIDEVSMLRADILDAVDFSLRHFRRSDSPFGGVQMLYIGDMFQLPPVVKDYERGMLAEHYKSPFFFHSKALMRSPPVYIEFKKIYRQNEQSFIDILNKIRNGAITAEELAVLNRRYNPGFGIPKDKNYVVLSTHNYLADRINKAEMDKLRGEEKIFTGTIKGTFSETSYPTDIELRVKIGAQVMFIRNDSERRYYNGKIGIVTGFDDKSILVLPEGSDMEIEVASEVWKNVRYTLNKEKNTIEEEELGSFEQFPIRPAWAITIHKSQGLTFERAIIDAGQAFAAGQVYVALSRCTSLEGIVLYSMITPESIKTDHEVMEFAKKEKNTDEINRILSVERPKYLRRKLLDAFDWVPAANLSASFLSLVTNGAFPDKEASYRLAADIKTKIREQEDVAAKFREQLNRLIDKTEKTGDSSELKDRTQKAAKYFYGELTRNVISPLDSLLDFLARMSRVKQYYMELKSIVEGFENFAARLKRLRYGDIPLTEGMEFEADKPKKADDGKPKKADDEKPKKKSAKPKPEKGSSQRVSLEMLRSGKSIAEIAEERALTRGTIEGHLNVFVLDGEVAIEEIVSDEKIKVILPLVDGMDELSTLSEIKQALGDSFSYGEIRAVLNHSIYTKKIKNQHESS